MTSEIRIESKKEKENGDGDENEKWTVALPYSTVGTGSLSSDTASLLLFER